MALVTTPGSASADSFASLAECEAYCLAQGLTDWTGAADSPAEPKEAALRRATAFLSNSFTWKGAKANGRSQALAWPRTDVEDEEGDEVDAETIPVEIVQATCIIAVRELVTPGYMNPAVVMTDRVKSERVGPLAVEYQTTSFGPEAARPVLLQVNDLVGGLVSTTGSAIVGSALRS
jgi:hypothetical protein